MNYYVKHLMQDGEGKMNKAMEWLADNKDPKIICHPAVVMFTDMFWGQLANRYFGRQAVLLFHADCLPLR